MAKATGVPIPKNYPVVGDDAFRTGTGVHAAAVIKAYRKNDIELANSIYSGVPSHYFGMEQVIEIGPMSGKSNVHFWLERHGYETTDELVDRIYQAGQAVGAYADGCRNPGGLPGRLGSAIGDSLVDDRRRTRALSAPNADLERPTAICYSAQLHF